MNVSYFYRIFLGCFLGLCCALFSVPVSAAKFGDVIDVTITREHVGPRLDSRKAFLNSGARITNLSYNRATATWEGELAGRLLGHNRPVRYPLKMTPLVGPTINAAKNLLLRNPYVFVGTAAVGYLVSEGFFIDEENNVLLKDVDTEEEYYLNPSNYVPPDSGYFTSSQGGQFQNAFDACAFTSGCISSGACNPSGSGSPLGACRTDTGSAYGAWSPVNVVCSNDAPLRAFGCVPVYSGNDGSLVEPSDLDGLDNSFWDNFLDDPDTFGVASADVDLASNGQSNFNARLGSIPSIDLDSTTSTKTLPNGDTEVTESSKKLLFSPRNPEGSAPEMSVKEEEAKKTYINGQLVSEEDVEVEKNPSGSDGGAEAEQLTGCALFDPFCRWAEWTQQDLGEEEPDLSSLMHDFEPENDEFMLTLGAASCPAPIDVELSIIGRSVELSYEPICDLVEFIRPLILASAYLFAAYLYLGVLRG